MTYRLYAPHDFEALYALEEKCFEPPFRFDRGYMRQLVERRDAATWIAEEDGHLAGFAVAEWQSKAGKTAAYIVTLEVLVPRRGQGIGGELLHRIEDSARAVGAVVIGLHVDAENAGAIRLYQAHGYCFKGREENFYPQGHVALIYEKTFVEKPLTVSLL